MSKQFRVRGLDPLGRYVEFVWLTKSAIDARRQAEEVGLRFVTVGEVPHWSDPDALADDGMYTEPAPAPERRMQA